MAGEVERFVRIQNPAADGVWRTIPNCEKLGLLDISTLMTPDDASGISEKRFIFHVRFADGIRKGSRVSYLGNRFTVLSVSDPKRLTGLELSCTAAAD